MAYHSNDAPNSYYFQVLVAKASDVAVEQGYVRMANNDATARAKIENRYGSRLKRVVQLYRCYPAPTNRVDVHL